MVMLSLCCRLVLFDTPAAQTWPPSASTALARIAHQREWDVNGNFPFVSGMVNFDYSDREPES
jgi:hypothetical protein